MSRGEIWKATAGRGYAGKPQPIGLVQDDRFDATNSVTVFTFTNDPTEGPPIELLLGPDQENDLHEHCSLMVDKLTTMLRSRIGRLSGQDMVRLARAIVAFLGSRAIDPETGPATVAVRSS
ncbi:MAG: type II toxin-antitoxin system PemK/MazF family toxin [bacterium]|nr:type II toxin-antitoxin system PemK/MazF family toxin [bacterium]